jgi:hypothetical protein
MRKPDAEDQEHEQLAQGVESQCKVAPQSGIEGWRTVAADAALANIARSMLE